MKNKKTIIFSSLLIILSFFFIFSSQAASFAEKLKGKILLQVEENGEAWYVYPNDLQKYYLGRPADAFQVMRNLGLGISEKNFNNLNGYGKKSLSGKILLRVEANGEAYYVNTYDLKLYYLGRPADAFEIMRSLGLGITNDDLAQVVVSSQSTKPISENSLNNKTENQLIPDAIDFSHLPEKEQLIVQAWQNITLENFNCNKLKSDSLSFVFVPLEYSDYNDNAESRADFILFSQYYIWAVNEEEPFNDYAATNNYYTFTDFSKINNNIYQTIDNIVGDCDITNTTRPLFIFVKNAKASGLGSAYASFSRGQVTIKNPGYKKMIVSSDSAFLSYHHEPPHETGHAFAGFLDEYSQGTADKIWPSEDYEYINDQGVLIKFSDNETPFNKGEAVPSCPSLFAAEVLWGDLVDSELSNNQSLGLQIGYHEGCSGYKNRYKASSSNMMATGNEFNLVQKRFLCKLLIKKTNKTLGYCENFY